MNARRTQGTHGSATKDFITLSNSSCQHLCQLLPQSHRATWRGPGDVWTNNGFCYRTLHPGKISILYNGRAVLDLPPKGDIIFDILDSTQTCSFLWRETISIFSKPVHYSNVLEKTVQNKGQLLRHSQDVPKHERTMENCLPTPRSWCLNTIPYLRKHTQRERLVASCTELDWSQGWNLQCRYMPLTGNQILDHRMHRPTL